MERPWERHLILYDDKEGMLVARNKNNLCKSLCCMEISRDSNLVLPNPGPTHWSEPCTVLERDSMLKNCRISYNYQ